jgi:hypothetical protein
MSDSENDVRNEVLFDRHMIEEWAEMTFVHFERKLFNF